MDLALFFLLLSSMKKNDRSLEYIFLGLVGSLLLMSFQPAAAVVFSTIALAVIVVSGIKKVLHHLMLALIFPSLILTCMVFKTGLQHGVYAPTTGMGHSFVQNLNLSVFDPYNKKSILDFAKEERYPSWWVWCFQNAPGLLSHWGSCDLNKNNRDFRDLKTYLVKKG